MIVGIRPRAFKPPFSADICVSTLGVGAVALRFVSICLPPPGACGPCGVFVSPMRPCSIAVLRRAISPMGRFRYNENVWCVCVFLDGCPPPNSRSGIPGSFWVALEAFAQDAAPVATTASATRQTTTTSSSSLGSVVAPSRSVKRQASTSSDAGPIAQVVAPSAALMKLKRRRQ